MGLIIMGFLEILIRAQPRLFGDFIGNYVFSRYGTFPGAIYYREPELRLHAMWPEFETRAYYNGHFWTHQADARGFRNPPDRATRILLLGDSMIYGHGAELEDTGGEVLHDRYGYETYNVSKQGDSLYQQYLKLRLYAEDLAPEHVILFVFKNDIWDLGIYRSPEQIEAATELGRDDYPQIAERIEEMGRHRPTGISTWPAKIASLQLLGGSYESAKRAIEGWLQSDAPPTLVEAILDDETLARGARYYDRIFADLVPRLRAQGTRLTIVHLDLFSIYGEDAQEEEARQRLTAMLSEVTARHGLPYLDTGEMVRSCDGCLLERDGHFSVKGHARLARFLDENLLGEAAPAAQRPSEGEGG
jgi:hypothetical protein